MKHSKDKGYANKKEDLSCMLRKAFKRYVKLGLEDGDIAQELYESNSKTTRNNVRKLMESLINHFLDKSDLGGYDRRPEFIEYIKINDPSILHPKYINEDLYNDLISEPLPPNSPYRLLLKARDKDRDIVIGVDHCYQGTCQGKRLLKIKGSDKSGKTSEIIYLTAKFVEKSYEVVKIDFDNMDIAKLKNRKLLMNSYIRDISRQLDIKLENEDCWKERIKEDPCEGSKEKLKEIIKDFSSKNKSKSKFLVLIVENMDKLLGYPETAECFYSLTRNIFEKLKDIRQIITYSTNCYLDINEAESPFNVGESITLCGFDAKDIQQLNEKHYIDLSRENIDSLIDWMGGHPYLWQLALPYFKKPKFRVEDFKKGTITNYGKYKSFLKNIRNSLSNNKELTKSFIELLNTNSSVELDIDVSYILEGIGLIKRDLRDKDRDRWIISCQMYKVFFQKNPPRKKIL